MSEWKLETKVTNKLRDMLDSMYTYYRYEEVELCGRPYLKVTSTSMNRAFLPYMMLCNRWVGCYQDKYPIDICNVSSNGSFYVAEIYKRSWDSAPFEWKKHNRDVVGY